MQGNESNKETKTRKESDLNMETKSMKESKLVERGVLLDQYDELGWGQEG
jgi:hypothetical protein